MTSPKGLEFNVDEPIEGQEFASGEVSVRGWAIAAQATVSIRARVGNGSWIDVSHGQLRSDVAKAFPDEPDALCSGFSGSVDVGEVSPGSYDFILEIRPRSGAGSTIQRKIVVLEPVKSKRETVVSLSDETLRINLDYPSEDSLVLKGSILRVTGWAVATKGVKTVDIWLDGQGPYSAHYGLMREDVGARYHDFTNASHAGFLWARQIDGLAAGTHALRIVCTSNLGRAEEINASFRIDPRTEYDIWSSLTKLDRDQLLRLFEKSADLPHTPKISILTPVFRTPEAFLKKCVDSVKKQVYSNWEMILVDDCSSDVGLTSLLEKVAEGDRRIKTRALLSNRGISGATNAGLEICTGEYVALLDHDDEISPDALLRVVETLVEDPSLDVLYSDEDKLDEQGTHKDVFFKPDWSPDLLLSMNYVCHFLVCRRSLLQEVGGLRLGFDGSQDHDLILRLSERTAKIKRIPRVLYHWRMHEQSTASGVDRKPTASKAGRRAIEEHLKRTGVKAQVLELGPGRYRPKYDIAGEPEVAIIIPTGGSPTLETALESILRTTTYPNYHFVVIDNSSGEGVFNRLAAFRNRGHAISTVDCRGLPFNFSLLCNRGTKATDAHFFIFLNDDTSIITPDWIESMLEHAQRPSIGAVGSLLLFPDGTIQHAGVTTGLFDIAGHPFRGLPEKPYYFDFTHVIRNCSAVTGACLMTRRDVFEELGGFDEKNLPTCFQDVDLCLKIVDRGLRIVYTPFAKLFHYESFSKRAVAELPELKYMKTRWVSFLADDPYYNPNLTRSADDYSLRYDHLFLRADAKGEPHGLKKRQAGAASAQAGVQTPAAKRLRRFGNIEFYASPSMSSSDKRGRRATLFWKAAGADKVQVRVGFPMGPLFTQGGSTGSAAAGDWVEPGTLFYLLDATESAVGSPDRVLSALRV